jgi:tetratricopeptide (TPR) repeat protein
MNAFQVAIAQANRACSLVEAGAYDDAISQFVSTLSAVKCVMTQAEEKGSIKYSLDQCMTSQSKFLSSSTVEEIPGRYLYRRAIFIPINMEMTYGETIMVSCLIIMNLAIAYHLRGDQEALLRAMKLYELSFNLQRDQQFGSNVLFTLAIVNNLGVVHQQLHDEQAAVKCFEHVLSTLMYLKACGHSSECNLDGFFHNVLSVAAQQSVAPAA